MALEAKTAQPVLPLSVVTKSDVGRLLREAEAVHEFLDQAAIRQPGTAVTAPKTSRLLNDIALANGLNLLTEKDRGQLLVFLGSIRDTAPSMHMSFSVEPTPAFLQKITEYLRQNIHPYALLQIGLQPTIGAGFMLRTTNKYYDFSMRATLKAKRELLLQDLRKMRTAQPVAPKEQP